MCDMWGTNYGGKGGITTLEHLEICYLQQKNGAVELLICHLVRLRRVKELQGAGHQGAGGEQHEKGRKHDRNEGELYEEHGQHEREGEKLGDG